MSSTCGKRGSSSLRIRLTAPLSTPATHWTVGMMPRMFRVPAKREPSTSNPSKLFTGASGSSASMSVANSRLSRSGESGRRSIFSVISPPCGTPASRCPSATPYRITAPPSGISSRAILCPWGICSRATTPHPASEPSGRSATGMATLSLSSTLMTGIMPARLRFRPRRAGPLFSSRKPPTRWRRRSTPRSPTPSGA